MKYLFIDTNIYIACSLLIKHGHEPETIEKLNKLLNSNKLILILPEIIELEFFRELEVTLTQIKKSCDNFKKEFKKSKIFPSYLNDEKEKIFKIINQIYEKREESSKESKNRIMKLFKHNNVEKIPLNFDIFLNGYKRVLSGKKPCKSYKDEKKHIIDADSMIVESIIYFTKDKKNIDFILCSDNHKDFGIYEEEIKDHILHDDIKEDLPKNTKYYTDLFKVFDEELDSQVNVKEQKEIKNNLTVLETIQEERIKIVEAAKEYLANMQNTFKSIVSASRLQDYYLGGNLSDTLKEIDFFSKIQDKIKEEGNENNNNKDN